MSRLLSCTTLAEGVPLLTSKRRHHVRDFGHRCPDRRALAAIYVCSWNVTEGLRASFGASVHAIAAYIVISGFTRTDQENPGPPRRAQGIQATGAIEPQPSWQLVKYAYTTMTTVHVRKSCTIACCGTYDEQSCYSFDHMRCSCHASGRWCSCCRLLPGTVFVTNHPDHG